MYGQIRLLRGGIMVWTAWDGKRPPHTFYTVFR